MIVGYIGNSAAAPQLLEGLAKLEYRGYDLPVLLVKPSEKIKPKSRMDAILFRDTRAKATKCYWNI